MKKIIEVTEVANEGLEALLGQQVLLMCANYFYIGKLVGVNDTCVLLAEPAIVYETGDWRSSGFKDAQRLHADQWYVQRSAIESFGASKC